jgi:peptidoglycan hydrolase-like protein with peptidoglycan-binding domain
VIVAAAIALSAATAAAVATRGGGTAVAADPRPAATATVTRQDLAERTTVDGTLGYGRVSKLSARSAGTLTWLAREGATVAAGGRLYSVDQRPVVLLPGTVPAYRRLAVGAEGVDVRQLEKGLRGLGYTGFDVDDDFTAATARAVRDWQDDVGAKETGAVELGDVVFKRAPLRIGAHTASVGDQLVPGASVMDTTGTEPVVTIDLAVSNLRLVRRGAGVSVELPNGGSVTGRVRSVASAARAATAADDAEPTIQVAVTLQRGARVGGIDQAPVDVSVESRRRSNVLTVPVTALLALAEGGYGVRVVESGGARVVPVKPGMFADGRVEVSATGLREGMKVEVPAS